MLKYFRHENGDKTVLRSDHNFTQDDLNTILSTPLSKEGVEARDRFSDELIQDDDAFREFQKEMRKTGVVTNQSVAIVMNSKRALSKVGAVAITKSKAKKDPTAQIAQALSMPPNSQANNNKRASGGLLNLTSVLGLPGSAPSKPRQRTSATKEKFLEDVKAQRISFGRSRSQGDISAMDKQQTSFSTRVSSFVRRTSTVSQRNSVNSVGGINNRGSFISNFSTAGGVGSQRGSFVDSSEPRSRLSIVGLGDALRNASFAAASERSFSNILDSEQGDFGKLNALIGSAAAVGNATTGDSSHSRRLSSEMSDEVLVDFPAVRWGGDVKEEDDEDASLVMSVLSSARLGSKNFDADETLDRKPQAKDDIIETLMRRQRQDEMVSDKFVVSADDEASDVPTC